MGDRQFGADLAPGHHVGDAHPPEHGQLKGTEKARGQLDTPGEPHWIKAIPQSRLGEAQDLRHLGTWAPRT